MMPSVTSPTGYGWIITKHCTDRVPRGVFNIGDVIVIAPTTTHPVGSGLVSLLRSIEVLRNEIGTDGRWILESNDSASDSQFTLAGSPRLHYLDPEDDLIQNLGLHLDSRESLNLIGVSGHTDEAANEDTKKLALAHAVVYQTELINIASNNLWNDIESMRGTQTTTPSPQQYPALPRFPSYHFPKYGDGVLLVIPTQNKFKTQLLSSIFESQAPEGVTVRTFTAPVESNVGEQPYNEAGVLGAYNRICNALARLDCKENKKMLEEWNIGTVIAASIENFIQTENVGHRPTDYGTIIIHNATTNQTRMRLSQGTTVPRAYVDRAQRFGFDDNRNHGRVTVGKILAANVPGLDKGDWHRVLTGTSRYDLLTETAKAMEIPW